MNSVIKFFSDLNKENNEFIKNNDETNKIKRHSEDYMIGPVKFSRIKSYEKIKRKILFITLAPHKVIKMINLDLIKPIYIEEYNFSGKATSIYSGKYGIDYIDLDFLGQIDIDTRWQNISGIYLSDINKKIIIDPESERVQCLKNNIVLQISNDLIFQSDISREFELAKNVVSRKESERIAKKFLKYEIKCDIEDKIAADYKCNRAEVYSFSTTYQDLFYQRLFIPMWYFKYEYKNNNYEILINAVTGVCSLEYPFSKSKLCIYIFCLAMFISYIFML